MTKSEITLRGFFISRAVSSFRFSICRWLVRGSGLLIIQRDDVRRFLEILETPIADHVSALRQFYRFLQLDGHISHDPTLGIESPRQWRRLPLSDMKSTLVIQDNDTALAVLVRYEQYLAIQEQIKSLKETIQILTDEKERAAVYAGLRDLADGHVRPLSEVKAAGSKTKESKDKNDKK
jgi:hypothetical protein